MRKHKWIVFLIAVLAAALLVYFTTFTVSFSEIAIVKTFGRAGAPMLGSQQAGLHFKFPPPIQRLVRYDGRTFIFDDTHEQVQTEDKQNVLVTVFCAWRIQDPNVFLRSIRTVDDAQKRMRETVRSVKTDVIGTHPLRDFLNTDPDRIRFSEIEQEMKAAVRKQVENAYGVDVVAMGIKSFGLPQKVTETVIKSMTTERKRYAEDYRSRGASEAELIVSQARTAQDQIMVFARELANDIKTKGDEAAAEYYTVYEEDKEFAIFLREMEFIAESLQTNTVIILTPELERSVGYFMHGPSARILPGQVTTRRAGPAKD